MPVLKYEQIADDLRARIADGEYGPGAMVPSGRDLCEQWSVSRATVIKAMDVLRNDGLVTGRQGSGFSVVETPVARPAGSRSVGTTRLAGGLPYRRLGMPTKETPSQRVAEALGVAPHEVALRRARLMLLDGEPFSLVTAWFPEWIADACPRLGQAGPIAEGTTRYVGRTTGRYPTLGSDVTTVRLATGEEADQLQVERPTAVAVVLHVARDRDGEVLVCEEGVTPSSNWQLIEAYSMGSQV